MDDDLPSIRSVDIGRNVRKFWHIIRKHVLCSDLLFMPGMADCETREQIFEKDREGNHLDAADIFLMTLENMRHHGKWDSFLMALKEKEYEYVAEIIEGTVNPDTASAEAYIRLVSEVFGDVITKKVYAMDLLPYLVTEGLIDDRGKEKLMARNTEEGNSEAMMLLLISLIWRRQKNWYKKFLRILIQTGNEELAKLIGDTDYEKITAEDENGGMTDSNETVRFGARPDYKANPTYSPLSVSGGSLAFPVQFGVNSPSESQRSLAYPRQTKALEIQGESSDDSNDDIQLPFNMDSARPDINISWNITDKPALHCQQMGFNNLSTNGALEEKEEEEEEEVSQRTLHITGIPTSVSEETVDMYLENKRKGGGTVEDHLYDTEKGTVIVTFENEEVAENFLSKEHILGGKVLTVKWWVPPKPVPMYKDRLLLSGVKETTTQDCLTNFLEAKIGCEPKKFICGDEPGVYMVVFKENPDIGKLQAVCRKRRLEGAMLTVSPVPVSRTVKVKNLKSTITKESLELYFESEKRSRGGEVEAVELLEYESAGLVTFLEPEVAIRVCEKQDHQLAGSKLEVSLYRVCQGRCQQVYRDRVLLRGVSDKTTSEILNNFLEAKLSCVAQEFLCGEQPGVILVIFGSKPDIGKLERICQTTPLEGAQLAVEQVQISHTVLVKNLPASAAQSQDAIQLYFEAVKRSSGGEVSNMRMIPNKNSCLVSFEDPRVALRVSDRTHKMDGSILEVSVFYPCLGLAGGIPLGDFRLPAPLELKGQDRYKLLYLKGSSSLSQAMQKELAEAHAQIRWPKKKSGTTVQFDCTLTADIEGAARLAWSWAETVQTTFQRYANDLIDLKQKKVKPGLWPAVEANLSKVQVQNKEAVTLFVEKDEHLLIFAGLRHAVGEIATQMNELVSSLEEEAERKKKETEDSIKIKPMQSLLLKALKFSSKAESRHLGLFVDIQTTTVTFRGLPDDVKKALVEMFEILNGAGSQDFGDFTKEQLSWLDGTDNKRRLVEQFRAEKLVAVWEVVGSKITLLASSPFDADRVAGILKRTLMEATDLPRPANQRITLAGGLTVAPYTANITKLKVCAIINATNERLQFTGGVSRAIADAAGADFEKECKTYIDNNGPIAVSDVCVTGPGKLPCDMVIHAVSPRWDSTKPAQCKKQLHDTYVNILEEAEKKDCREIAVPAISSGIFGMPQDLCIDAYSTALIYFDKSNPGHTLKKVHFVDIKDDLPAGLTNALNRLVSSGTARSGRSPSPIDGLSSFTGPSPGFVQ